MRRTAEKLLLEGSASKDDEKEWKKTIEDMVLDDSCGLPISELVRIVDMVFIRTTSRLGLIAPYVEDDSVREIMVNGPDDIFCEFEDGIRQIDEKFGSTEELEDVIRSIAAGVHREINEMNPILDARLPGGSRVNAVYKNVAAGGPVLTVRKFSKERITIDQMIDSGTLTTEAAAFLKNLVRAGYNIFISGGTSSGKTTFLNALSDYIPSNERVIVIEDSRELWLPNIANLVQMECHGANTLGKGKVSMDMLIRTSLRMRPDRIIVGEIRGKEVTDMLQAMNTGHDGSMSTGHGNSVSGMLRRLEAMYLMGSDIPMDSIRAQIVEGIDIMVHLERLEDGRRRVVEVQELTGVENGKYTLVPLFSMNDSFELVRTDEKLRNSVKLRRKGLTVS